MQKLLARQLQEDYIPTGGTITRDEFQKMKFRRTREDEVYQCGVIVGHDPQSTHLYCGKVAEWVHFTSNGAVALCNQSDHAPASWQREEEKTPIIIELPDGVAILLPNVDA